MKRNSRLHRDRGDAFDLRLERTWELVREAREILARMPRQQRALEKSQKAFLDSLRKGGNGSHRSS